MARRITRSCIAVGLLAGGLVSGGDASAQVYYPDYRQVVTLHEFGANEPGDPIGAVVFDKAGNLYATESGAAYGKPGAVFELIPPPAGAPYKGWKETVLHNFVGGTDGNSPMGQLLVDASGNLYGTTYLGGGACTTPMTGCGIVFELSPPAKGATSWIETILYRFTGGSDGRFPSELTFDSNGNIFGTTHNSGDAACDCGTVYELSPPQTGQIAWKFKVLFASTTDSVAGKVVFDGTGSLYGVTSSTAFKLSPPMEGQTA
jgi:hypothetical protein